MDRLDQHGIDSLPIADSAHLDKIRHTLRRFCETNAQSPDNVKLQDLCEKAQAQ
jgi:hypothetical protein